MYECGSNTLNEFLNASETTFNTMLSTGDAYFFFFFLGGGGGGMN